METKLTLRLDAELIKNAKTVAGSKGVSLSKIVADYFKRISVQPHGELEKSPVLAEITGILPVGAEKEELLKSYRQRLEQKYK